MKADSIKSAVYVNGVFSTGSANDRGADQSFAFQGSLHRSHNFGIFQAYYGAGLSLGSYHVTEFYNSGYYFDSLQNSYVRNPLNHIPHSNNFFGCYGISGGMNIVASHQHVRKYRHSEWRILGLETSLQQEFGNYSNWRAHLPDTAANIIFRKQFSAYLGLYTEWLWTNRDRIEFGFKIATGMDLNPSSSYSYYYTPSVLPLSVFSITYHMKIDHFTGFIQANFGTYADNIQFGLSYRLGKK